MLMVILFFVTYQWMWDDRSLRGAADEEGEEEAERNGERRGYSDTNLYE
jgi:hypothetical protein